jgi:prepilin-type N-terminal cleavage/methylation domain-containing protein
MNKFIRLNSFNKGFTLIELVVVVGLLSILLAITLIAINPGRQFEQARNTQRSSDVKAILDAISQFSIDENGLLPGDGLYPGGGDMIINTPREISSSEANICAQIRPLYIAALPIDPGLASSTQKSVTDCAQAGGYNTGYTVRRQGSRVVVAAPLAENSVIINVTR